MADMIGPALPPGYGTARANNSDSSDEEPAQGGAGGGNGGYGPVLPASLGMGPDLSGDAAGTRTRPKASTRVPDSDSAPAFVGPMPPSGPKTVAVVTSSGEEEFRQRQDGGLIGPVPPSSGGGAGQFGPSLPPGFVMESGGGARDSDSGGDTSDSGDDMIGPIPSVGRETLERERKRADFESRAVAMKDRLTGKESTECSKPQREEWMTSLPENTKAFGPGPRKFRTTNFDPGDRSVWTDTPADRHKKAQEAAAKGASREKSEKKKGSELPAISARDQDLSERISDYNVKHRAESLVSMHQRKRKAEVAVAGKAERRPFDRDTDLALPKSMAPAKRQAMMKSSSKSLSTKFAHGDKHFL